MFDLSLDRSRGLGIDISERRSRNSSIVQEVIMMRTFSLLMRGAIADNAQAIHDANAVAILRQQIRDAAGALSTARRELAVAMAYHSAELRALDALGTRIESVSAGARKALADGREDLGEEAAVLIAAL
jgi:phage shock protein A